MAGRSWALAARRRPRTTWEVYRGLGSSSMSDGDGAKDKEEGQQDKDKEDEEARLGGADFKVVAAGNQ